MLLVRFVAGVEVGGQAGAGAGPGEGVAGVEQRAIEDVAQEAGHIAGVKLAGDAGLDVAEGIEQDRRAGQADFPAQAGQLIAVAPGSQPQLLDQAQVLLAQQVQREDASIDDEVMAVVGLPDFDENTRAVTQDAGIERRHGDLAVGLTAVRGGNGNQWRPKLAGDALDYLFIHSQSIS